MKELKQITFGQVCEAIDQSNKNKESIESLNTRTTDLELKTDGIERKDGSELLHVITADEAAEWNAEYGSEHYKAGDSLLEINANTPARYIKWNDKSHTLHVEQYDECHNEITIYAIETSKICIDDINKIGDIIAPSESKKVAYNILDGVIICGEITEP